MWNMCVLTRSGEGMVSANVELELLIISMLSPGVGKAVYLHSHSLLLRHLSLCHFPGPCKLILQLTVQKLLLKQVVSDPSNKIYLLL